MTVRPVAQAPFSALVTSRRSAATCRWATPTLMLAAPIWFDAEDSPWSCVHGAAPRLLVTTDGCDVCPRWESRHGAVPLMVDWFGAFPPPHEAD